MIIFFAESQKRSVCDTDILFDFFTLNTVRKFLANEIYLILVNRTLLADTK